MPIFSYLCFREQNQFRSPCLSGPDRASLGSEFLRNGRKPGRLNLSHSIKTVALKLSTRNEEQLNILYQFTIHTCTYTHTRLRWQTARSTGKPSNCLHGYWICSLGQGWTYRERQYSAICRLFCHNNRKEKFHLTS